MKPLLSPRRLAVGIALASAFLLVTASQAIGASHLHSASSRGALVGVRRTALGSILVNAGGHTLYLFEKDRNGVSMCDNACVKYWPRLISHGRLRAGKGVNQSLLGLTRSRNGTRQVTYAGHPLYKFVGDRRTGQTSGEGLANFGAEWYAVAANGHKVERNQGGAGSGSPSGGYGGW